MNNLDRFLEAQERDYETALNEIRQGQKRSHWIWYIFPQIAGLGMSSTSQYYGIKDLAEAEEYLNNAVLRNRLLEITGELLKLPTSDEYSGAAEPPVRSKLSHLSGSGEPPFRSRLSQLTN